MTPAVVFMLLLVIKLSDVYLYYLTSSIMSSQKYVSN